MRKILALFLSLLFFFSPTVWAEKTIGIFTFLSNGAKPWDPDSVKSGITGSEEAVIYMSQKLAELGYSVTVFGAPPENSPHSQASANPRFVPLSFQEEKPLDIAIAWRLPSMGESLKGRAKQVYFWPHDTWTSPLPEHQINSFTDVLWLSNWQQKQWASVNNGFAKFTKIFGNGINPDQFPKISDRKNPYSCIYSSNYGRGLELLLDIWPQVKQEFPEATLDIYYGWQHWGILSPEKEAKMRKQVEDLKNLGVTEHGMVSHEELNTAMANASFWTYPCIEAETFCITAIRAQLSGAIPVIIQHSGLYETTRNGYHCNQKEQYLPTLRNAMQNAKKITLAEREQMGRFILEEFTWKELARKWDGLFTQQAASPLEEKQTVCLAMTVKNNASTLKATLTSLKDHIDSWVIVDEGSTDGSQEIIQECLQNVPGSLILRSTQSTEEILSLAETKADYVLLVEPDEELFFAKDFSFSSLKEDSYVSFINEKRALLHKTGQGTKNTKKALLPGVISSKDLQHQSQGKSEEYLKALHTFYFAQSYLKADMLDKAFDYHNQVISLKNSGFPIAASFYYLGILSEFLGKDQTTVLQNYSNAYLSNVANAEPLFRMAVYYFSKQNYLLGYATAKLALSQEKPVKSSFGEDWIYDQGIPFVLGNCAFHLNRFLEAKEAYELALSRPSTNYAMEKEIRDNLTKANSQLEVSAR